MSRVRNAAISDPRGDYLNNLTSARFSVPRATTARLRQLDSLRGVAALFVVFNHYMQTIPEHIRLAVYPGVWMTPWPWLRFTPIRLVVNGEAAVDLFFVLSGFVLALPLKSDRQPQLPSFLIKRFCRVYLPFATVILLVAVAYAVIPTTQSPPASHWLNGLLPPPNYSLVSHLLMTGQPDDMTLDPVMWTLVHEIRISAFLPLLFLSIRRFGSAQTVTICLAISLSVSFTMTDSVSGSWQATLHFLWMFAAGSALSFNRNSLVERTWNYRLTACLWILSIGLLIVPFNRVWADFFIGSGAILLIVLCLPKSAVVDALTSLPLLWLGRISYSLYLIHLPILIIAVTGGCIDIAPSSLALLFIITLILAEVIYRTIESPAHKIGIFLSKIIGNTRPPT